MKSDTKTYLFDFDGTLVDSMPTYVAVMKSVLDDAHISYGPDLLKIITPLGYAGTADYYISTMGLNESKENIIKKMTERAELEYTFNIKAKSNVERVLKSLKQDGHSLNILTASPHATLDPCLKRLGIFDLFDNVWSCNDFGTTKSDPEIYRAAAARIGTDIHNIIFLDDNPNADRTARSAGAYVIGVYDDSSAEYVDEMKSICDAYIYDFSELIP